jgi:catechol 2,3-dioxygenase-like lactoylglutathione lyase family enzyme
MIHHLSIAARDPKYSAEVLAEIMGGKAVPFPPNPGSFFALQLDDHGSGVEVYPAGTELQPAGEEGGSFVRKPREGRGFGATHFALSVATDASIVKQIAERAGWHCVTCNRGPFHVIEVWVENDTMVEVLPPDFAAEYLAWTRPDTVATRMGSVGFVTLLNEEREKLRVISPQATTARQVSIAAARKPRCVDADVR